MTIDDKDEKILSQLKENSRKSIRDIARATDIRPSTVHQRIKKLEEREVIEKFTVKLNNKQIGEDFIVFMLVTSDQKIDDKILQDKHVKQVFGVTGEYDLIFKLKFSDIEAFNNYLLKFREETGIKKTITMVSTITLKEEI